MPIRLIKRTYEVIRYYVVGLYNRAGDHHVFLMSGGLAFSLFVSAVPFALVVLAILGNLFERPEIVAKIYETVDTLVPYPDQAAPIKTLLASRFDQVSSVTEVAGVIGFFALMLSATALLSSLRTILNVVFQTDADSSVWLGKLWDFLLVIIILVVTVVLTVSIPVIEAGLELADRLGIIGQSIVSGLDKFFLNATSFVSLYIAFGAIYWLVPVRRPAGRTILIGALVSTLLWTAAKELFGFYIGHAATLKHVYGVYTFLIVAAFWIYYSALILILGAEFAQLYFERSVDSRQIL